MAPRPSAVPRRPEPTPAASPLLWQRFMGEFGSAPFETAEGDEAVTGRSPHREGEAGHLVRNLRETMHSSAYKERLAAAWTLLASWFGAHFPGWCCSTILGNLPCAVHVLNQYVQNLYGMNHNVTLAVETVLAVQA